MNPGIISLVLLAAALAPPAAAPPDVGQAERATIGQWRLSEIGGKVGCTLTLTENAGAGGRVLQAPPACHLAFPPLEHLSVWSVDPKGAPVFADAEHVRVVTFAGPPGGPFTATASDGKGWRLEPAAPRAPGGAAP